MKLLHRLKYIYCSVRNKQTEPETQQQTEDYQTFIDQVGQGFFTSILVTCSPPVVMVLATDEAVISSGRSVILLCVEKFLCRLIQ